MRWECQCKPLILLDDPDSRKVDQLLETLERIDDDCAVRGIHFVKVADDDKDENNVGFGIDKLPKLVYFNDKLPNMYEGRMYTNYSYNHIYLHSYTLQDVFIYKEEYMSNFLEIIVIVFHHVFTTDFGDILIYEMIIWLKEIHR